MTNTERHGLISRGFYVFPQVLNEPVLRRTIETSERVLAVQPKEHFEAQRSTGSMINTNEDPGFAELIAYPGTIDTFRKLGYASPRFSSGYVISKPPKSPRLFWHQDWWGWRDSSSYTDGPAQVFVMFYLTDTNRHNGCLRLIPGSHRKRHRLHDELKEKHSVYRKIEDPNHLAYATMPDEVDVPVKAGDLVIGDARILHAAHSNESDQRRTVVTLWYFPDFDSLAEPLKASMNGDGRHTWPDQWPAGERALLEPLRPRYAGTGPQIEWDRIPGPGLR